MICSYCKTENVADQSSCTFCAADLLATRPTQKRFIDIEDVLKPLAQKQQYHTFDLLLMLKVARKERSDAFTTLKTILKANNEIEVPTELKSDTEGFYNDFSAHVNQIEQILVDRLGYYPKRIDQKFLESYEKKLLNFTPDQLK